MASMPALTASDRSGQMSITDCRSEVSCSGPGGALDVDSASESEEFGAFSSITFCKSLEIKVGPVGLEPTTNRL